MSYYVEPFTFQFTSTFIDVDSGVFDVDCSLLYDAIKLAQASEEGIIYDRIAQGSGLNQLGPGVQVGITVELLGTWQLRFPEGNYVARVAGGNLIGGPNSDPIAYSAGVQTLLIQSAASTVVTPSVSGDWSDNEKNQIRHRLGIDGNITSPSTPPSLATPSTVRTELTTELSRIDVPISSRLEGNLYVTPPTVVEIRSEIDTNSTKLDVAVSTRNNVAPDNTSITAIKAKTDNLPTSPAAVSDIPTADQNATAVRTELTTELARIDANISSRNAIAPDNARILSIETLVSNLNDFDPSTQSVTVGTNNDKTGYSISGNITTLDNLNVEQNSQHGQTRANIAALNDISTTQVNTEVANALATYDPPTKSEMDAAFTEIKGAGWTTETLKDIRDNTGAIDNVAVATAVRTELTTELTRIDVPISSRLEGNLYVVPPTVIEIRNEIDTNSTKLDVAVSTRNNVAPDNTSIAAIKAKTDNLPSDPASQSSIKGAENRDLTQVYNNTPSINPESVWTYGTRTLTAGTKDTEIDAIKAKTDNLPASPAAVSDIPTAGQNATAVRTELTTELARIDANISSRESEANAAIRSSTNESEHNSTQSAIAALPTSSQIAFDILNTVVP